MGRDKRKSLMQILLNFSNVEPWKPLPWKEVNVVQVLRNLTKACATRIPKALSQPPIKALSLKKDSFNYVINKKINS